MRMFKKAKIWNTYTAAAVTIHFKLGHLNRGITLQVLTTICTVQDVLKQKDFELVYENNWPCCLSESYFSEAFRKPGCLNNLGQHHIFKTLQIPVLHHYINTACICRMLREAEQQFLIYLYTQHT